jgi:hypothetical protein
MTNHDVLMEVNFAATAVISMEIGAPISIEIAPVSGRAVATELREGDKTASARIRPLRRQVLFDLLSAPTGRYHAHVCAGVGFYERDTAGG